MFNIKKTFSCHSPFLWRINKDLTAGQTQPHLRLSIKRLRDLFEWGCYLKMIKQIINSLITSLEDGQIKLFVGQTWTSDRQMNGIKKIQECYFTHIYYNSNNTGNTKHKSRKVSCLRTQHPRYKKQQYLKYLQP